ncbi:site-specific integrase [Bifidobacterium samirii]|uniref:Recombinase n=1 Tax=Bifidobacterium samirii TaxID=2306974 RepID=A0A430FUM6_9BIFI|nr:site-specific integrase [Bifidobacterium samirii]RSX56782.1 recombinase [Bifidobacterium samirii]
MLLEDFWADRFRPYCDEALRESTVVGYESAWRLHVEPAFGAMDLDAISVALVDGWLAGFDRPGAARKAWSLLRAMLRRAIRWGLLDHDITRREVALPQRHRYEPRLLTVRQTRDLLRGFYGHELESWLICAISCGLRTEEGYGLEWRDVDLRRGVIHIERGLQWVSGHESVVEPKTELSRRTLPLPRFAVNRLRELRPREGGRLIGTLTPPQAAHAYASWCRRHGLPHVPARNLRHSWATNALTAGADIAVVSRMLGHSDIKTTAQYYLRPDITALRDAQRLFERALIG